MITSGVRMSVCLDARERTLAFPTDKIESALAAVITPDGKSNRIHGKAALDRLLSGCASNVCGVPGGNSFEIGKPFAGEFDVRSAA